MNLLDAIYTSSRRRRRIYILSAAEAVASRWLIYRDDILHIVHSNTQPRKPFDSSLDSFISPKSEFCYRWSSHFVLGTFKSNTLVMVHKYYYCNMSRNRLCFSFEQFVGEST